MFQQFCVLSVTGIQFCCCCNCFVGPVLCLLVKNEEKRNLLRTFSKTVRRTKPYKDKEWLVTTQKQNTEFPNGESIVSETETSSKFIFYHNKTPFHTVLLVTWFFAKKQIPVLEHPQQSDLASRNSFWWQVKIKVKVKLSLCLNWAPCCEGILGEWMYSSTHSWPWH
jgi:hypothetical protein